MADLFELEDLRHALQVPSLDPDAAAVARRRAYGWLKPATGLTDWPQPAPDDLWAWAVELAAIAYRNPLMLAGATSGAVSWTADRARWAQIVTAAREAYGGAVEPVYEFPEPDWHWTAETVQQDS